MPTNNSEAYDLYLKAESLRLTALQKNAQAALDLYTKAINLDPAFADALASDGELARRVWQQGWTTVKPNGAAALARANRSAERALALNPDQPFALLVLAGIATRREQHEKAVRLARQAVRANPKNITARIYDTYAMIAGGEYDEANGLVDSVIRDAPKLTPTDKYQMGIMTMFLRRPNAAIKYLNDMRADDPKFNPSYIAMSLAVNYGHAGQLDLARQEAGRLRKIWPGANYNAMWEYFTYHKNIADADYYAEGMGLAGIPQWAFGFQATETARVRGKELAMIFGTEYDLKGVYDGGTWHIDFVIERVTLGNYIFRGLMSTGRKFNQKGQDAIKDDKICQGSEKSQMSRPRCYPVYRNPNVDKDGYTYVYPRRNGVGRFSLVAKSDP